MNKNENGFSLTVGLLLILVIAVVGFGGYYVWHTQKIDKGVSQTTNSTSSQQKTSQSSQPADPTANWTQYKSVEGKYSLKYPSNWVTATHPELCSKGILLVAPSVDSVGKCGSESDGQMAFSGISDSKYLCYVFDTTVFSNITKTSVVVSGVTLTKQSGVTIDDTGGNGTLPKGTIEVNYCTGGSGWGFSALYDQKPSDPDVLSDFNTIVTKTLQFTK